MPRLAGQIFLSLSPLIYVKARSISTNSHHKSNHHGLEHLLKALGNLPKGHRWLVGCDNIARWKFASFTPDILKLHFDFSSNFQLQFRPFLETPRVFNNFVKPHEFQTLHFTPKTLEKPLFNLLDQN